MVPPNRPYDPRKPTARYVVHFNTSILPDTFNGRFSNLGNADVDILSCFPGLFKLLPYNNRNHYSYHELIENVHVNNFFCGLCFRPSAGARPSDKRRSDRDSAIEAAKSLTKLQVKSETVQVLYSTIIIVHHHNVQVLLKLLDCDVHISYCNYYIFFSCSQLPMSKKRLKLKILKKLKMRLYH